MICINILSFVLFREVKKHHCCFLIQEKDDPEYVLTDHLMIHFLELPKLAMYARDNELSQWLYFFKNEGMEDEKMTILLKDNPVFRDIDEEYKHFTREKQLKEYYDARQKFLLDQNSRMAEMEEAREKAMKEGLEQGIEQGLEQGREEGIELGIDRERNRKSIETAQKMRVKGYPISDIADITGLSEEEIEKL